MRSSAGTDQGVVAGGISASPPCSSSAQVPLLVDGEIVDHRLHGERHRVLQSALGLGHDGVQTRPGRVAADRGLKMKPMPPPDMPPSIQKPQKSAPNSVADARDQRLGVEVAGPGNDGLDRAEEIALGGMRRCASHVAGLQQRRGSRRRCAWPAAGLSTRPRSAADISRSPFRESARRPAPCRRAPAPGCSAAASRVRGETSSSVRHVMVRKQPPAADAELRIAFGCAARPR